MVRDVYQNVAIQRWLLLFAPLLLLFAPLLLLLPVLLTLLALDDFELIG